MPIPTLPIVIESLLGATGAAEGRVWEPFREGIDASWVYRSEDGGPAAALLRYQPGASAPAHSHAGWEHILVLSGSQADQRGSYGVGSLVVNPPGSEHSVDSPEGCIALLIWEKTPRFLGG